MIYKMELSDSVDTMVFDLLEVPIVDKDITGIAENTTIDGNVFNDYLWLKKQYVQKWSIMCQDEYDRLRGFWTRQFGNAEVPFYRLFYGENVYEDKNFLTSDGFTQITNPTERTAPLTLTKLTGNSTQQTYSGKNLIPSTPHRTGAGYYNASAGASLPAGTSAYVTTSVSGNTINIACSATWVGAVFLVEVVEGQTYHIHFHQQGTGARSTTYTLDSSYAVVRNTGNAASDDYTRDGNITVESGEKYIAIGIGCGNPAATITVEQLQVELGSSYTGWQEYVGGIPSPNPDFPQEIKTVTGAQTVKITGKNLFDGELQNGSYYTEASLGNRLYCAHTIKAQVGMTYTLSVVGDSSQYRFALNASDLPLHAGGSAVGTVVPYDSGWQTGQSVTATINYKYIGIVVSKRDNGNISPSDLDNIGIMLEKSATATAYEPYQSQSQEINLGSIELAKIGTYQDYIWNDDGTWYIHKEVGKVVLDGTESTWAYVSGQHARFQYTNSTIALEPSPSAIGAVMSDHFTASSTNDIYQGIDGKIGVHATIHQFWLSYLAITSLDDFKTWLSTHNTTVYYALATPTDTEITDSELIEQLNHIYSLYQGQNNLRLIPSAGAQGEMDGTYRLIYDEETDIIPKTPVVLTLTDGGVINPCGCRQNIQLIMRETEGE